MAVSVTISPGTIEHIRIALTYILDEETTWFLNEFGIDSIEPDHIFTKAQKATAFYHAWQAVKELGVKYE